MAGIRLLDKSQVTINYIINELLKPEIHKLLFDDMEGITEISLLLYDPRTVIYGIFSKGKPEPAGVVYFAYTVPYRNAVLCAVIFDPNNRNKDMISSVMEIIKKDFLYRYSPHTVISYITGENKVSEHMLEKLSFKLIGIRTDGIFADGRYQNVKIYQFINQQPEQDQEREK
jgi:RimJ/RimL family protein N-acetyltransferase